MVDVISGGRLNFGVGRGTPAELEQFGIGYEQSVSRLREGTAIIQQGWSEEAIDFTGELFDYQGVRILPKPVQQPHPPFWVAASRSDGTYRWAGEKGFHLLTLPYMYEPAILRTSIDHYREALVQAGHDPSTREVLGKFHIYVTDSAPRLWRRQGRICITTGRSRTPSTQGVPRQDRYRLRSRSRAET